MKSEILKFGIIGGIAFIIDIGLYNALRYLTLENQPITAKVISVAISTCFAWIGNRYWTYKTTPKDRPLIEAIMFILMNIIGMLISLTCIWISHYILGFTSIIADNISGNFIGLLLGTTFRFFSYRLWVFKPNKKNQNQNNNFPSSKKSSKKIKQLNQQGPINQEHSLESQ